MNIRSIIIKPTWFILVLILSFIFLTNTVSAETKTFIKEYTYQAGSEDSRDSSKTIALREVKRLLLEELAIYLQKQTEVKTFQLTKDQIKTITVVFVSAVAIEDKWDGKVYWLKAKMVANSEYVIKLIDERYKDHDKVKIYEELIKNTEKLLKENEQLNKQLKIAAGETKQKIAQAYKRNINNLDATEWLEKGWELSIAGNKEDAEKDFNEAIQLNPQYALSYYIRGVTYNQLENYQQAIKDFDKAIELNLKSAYAYGERGNAYFTLGEKQRAIKDFNEAIRIKPDYAASYNNRGLSYLQQGNNKQGCSDAQKACELGECKVLEFAKYRQGVCLQKQDYAIKKQNDAITYENLGVNYLEQGNNKLGCSYLKKACKLGVCGSYEFFKKLGHCW
jgi:tetratricopeptide (TPR) repeat protein